MGPSAQKQGPLAGYRGLTLTAIVVFLYAVFLQWVWGWASILSAWAKVGYGPIMVALTLLIGTYFVRAYRIYDYFRQEASGQFLRLFRVTQLHNVFNIMLPLRTGEASFPLLMRTEFGVTLTRGASALLVLRLLDVHVLLAVAGLGLVASAAYAAWAWVLWLALLAGPILLFPLRDVAVAFLTRHLPQRFGRFITEIDAGIPVDRKQFLRDWLLTAINWGVKIAVLAWVLGLMGLTPLQVCLGGALGGELSSILPIHAPAGIGTYPAGIAAGAALFGTAEGSAAVELLAKAAINTHLLMVVSALCGCALSLALPVGAGRA